MTTLNAPKITKKSLELRVLALANDLDFRPFNRNDRLTSGYTYRIGGTPVGTNLDEVSNTLDVMEYANLLLNTTYDVIFSNYQLLPHCYVGVTKSEVLSRFVKELETLRDESIDSLEHHQNNSTQLAIDVIYYEKMQSKIETYSNMIDTIKAI